jgi:hypothetical protein
MASYYLYDCTILRILLVVPVLCALEVSNPHPAGRTTAAAQTFLKTFLLFPYYSFSLNILFKKGEKDDAGP